MREGDENKRPDRSRDLCSLSTVYYVYVFINKVCPLLIILCLGEIIRRKDLEATLRQLEKTLTTISCTHVSPEPNGQTSLRMNFLMRK